MATKQIATTALQTRPTGLPAVTEPYSERVKKITTAGLLTAFGVLAAVRLIVILKKQR